MLKPLIETHLQYEEKKEIPCKDMDIDCLPDENGDVPFGSYHLCYVYDADKGTCPFVPFDVKKINNINNQIY